MTQFSSSLEGDAYISCTMNGKREMPLQGVFLTGNNLIPLRQVSTCTTLQPHCHFSVFPGAALSKRTPGSDKPKSSCAWALSSSASSVPFSSSYHFSTCMLLALPLVSYPCEGLSAIEMRSGGEKDGERNGSKQKWWQHRGRKVHLLNTNLKYRNFFQKGK